MLRKYDRHTTLGPTVTEARASRTGGCTTACLLLSLLTVPAAAQSFELLGPNTGPGAVSADGATVGGDYFVSSSQLHGMVWRDSVLTVLEDPPGGGDPFGQVNALSADGRVAVGYGHAVFSGNFGSTRYQTAVYWEDAGAPVVLQSADVQDPTNCDIGDSEALAIADSLIVGWASNCPNGEQSDENLLAAWIGNSLVFTQETPFSERIRGGISVALNPLRIALNTRGGTSTWARPAEAAA